MIDASDNRGLAHHLGRGFILPPWLLAASRPSVPETPARGVAVGVQPGALSQDAPPLDLLRSGTRLAKHSSSTRHVGEELTAPPVDQGNARRARCGPAADHGQKGQRRHRRGDRGDRVRQQMHWLA